MRYFLIALALAAPAAAQSAFATQFNGYSVSVVGPTGIQVKPPSEEIISIADKACGSVGKTADYQGARYIPQGSGEYFFLCL